jgi:DNA-binding response OmpR family regulator
MKPILVVEDETVMRESLRDWLGDEGYAVETAAHGEAALKAIGEQDFSVLILDIRLPGKNGLEVLKEARAQNPRLKGIIITAYPSVETAVEAMRIGAIDYLPKPLSLDALERLLEKTLGPVQAEIKPKAAPKETIAPPPAKVKEIITIAPEEIPLHIKQAKANFEAGHYAEALREFEAILGTAPGNIETRVWIQKTKQALAEPRTEATGVAEEVKPKECVWVKMGLVAQRFCTRNYDCLTCEFDQMMQEKMASGESTELDQALERFRELPGSQRLCRYAIKGDVSHRICSRIFQCVTCEFGQLMEDALQQKLAKLQARREALLKKEQKANA